MGALTGSAFDIDLRRGEANEDALVHLFLRSRVEVKTDYEARRTGNVAVEFYQGQPRRPSGIAVTKAEWYALHLVDIAWVLIETDRLKRLARVAHQQFGNTRMGDNHNIGVLVPIEWLLRRQRSKPLDL